MKAKNNYLSEKHFVVVHVLFRQIS